jgi:hypothetical protein
MLYRSALTAIVAMLFVAGCTPKGDGRSGVGSEPPREVAASAESSFTALQSRLESAAALALESSPTTDTHVGLPDDLRDLGVNGQADVVVINGERFVLLTGDKSAFRTWDGYLYSESGSMPPTRIGEGTTLRRSHPVAAQWWWISVNRVAVVTTEP